MALGQVLSHEPFCVVFYGSQAREDSEDNSDFNICLLASGLDNIRSPFIEEINKHLSQLAEEDKLTLHTNDFSTFKYRLSLFEPTSVHIIELGIPVFGEEKFRVLQKYWSSQKNVPIPVKEVVGFLESRSKFYRNLQSKTLLDDITRIEKILSLNIQMWVFTEINDLTPIEIAHLDIPSRLPRLVKYLYKENLPHEIHILSSIYEQVHVLKKNMRILKEGQKTDFEKLRDSILQIQEYTDEIAKI